MSSDAAHYWTPARVARWRDSLAGFEPMLAPVDAPLLDALALDSACRIADIGCGSGATTLAALQRAPAGSEVHGFDIAAPLLEVARARTSDAIPFEVCDVETAPPPARGYDRLLSRFGVMFFADPAGAFERLNQWLLPGGRLAFAVWGPPTGNAWMTTVREVVAEFVELEPPVPGAAGPFRYAEVEPLCELLARAGLAQVETQDWRAELPLGGRTADEAARFALSAFGRFADALAAVDADLVAQIERTLTARLEPHARDGAVRLPAQVHIVTAVRPAHASQ